MKISINIDPEITDTEITVSCREISAELEKIIASLRIFDRKITAVKNSETFILDVSTIIYIESVDRKTFVYTEKDCFESKLRLHEVEQQLCECGFLRVGKACIANLKFIRSLKTEMNHKLRITLENGEQLIVSRQYADELKTRLGVK